MNIRAQWHIQIDGKKNQTRSFVMKRGNCTTSAIPLPALTLIWKKVVGLYSRKTYATHSYKNYIYQVNVCTSEHVKCASVIVRRGVTESNSHSVTIYCQLLQLHTYHSRRAVVAQQFILHLKFLINIAWRSLQGTNRIPAVIFTSKEVNSTFPWTIQIKALGHNYASGKNDDMDDLNVLTYYWKSCFAISAASMILCCYIFETLPTLI